MYKNLIKELQKLGMQKNELLKVLNYDYQKKLTDRLSYNIEFNNDEKERIFKYLKEKGYKGSKKDLFIYSQKEKKEKNNDNEFSILLKQAMKKNKIRNKELCDLLNEEGFPTSENTISLWKNGKVDKPRTEYIIPLSKVLNINPRRLLGDHNEIIEDFVSEEYHRNKMEYRSLKDKIYSLIIQYQLERGYSHSDLKIDNSQKQFLEESIEDFIKEADLRIDSFLNPNGKIKLIEPSNAESVIKHYDSINEENFKKFADLIKVIDTKKQNGESNEIKDTKELLKLFKTIIDNQIISIKESNKEYGNKLDTEEIIEDYILKSDNEISDEQEAGEIAKRLKKIGIEIDKEEIKKGIKKD